MSIIVFGSSKGGAGKSTLCTQSVAAWLHGNTDIADKTLVIDADKQLSTTLWATARSDNAITPPVHIIEKTGGEVGRAAREMARHYERVYIDVPGHRSPEFRAALVTADLLVYPIRPSHFDAWALDVDLTEIVTNVRMINPALRVMVVMNGMSTAPAARASQQQSLRRLLAEYGGVYVTPHMVCHRASFGVAGNEGRGVTETEAKSASHERAVHEITMLAREIDRCLNDEHPECIDQGGEDVHQATA